MYRKHEFLKSARFVMKQLFQKNTIYVGLVWAFLFLILKHCGKKRYSFYTCELWTFPICFWIPPPFSSLTQVLHYEHIFQTRGVSSMSQLKRFSDLDITKQLAKDNTAFNFIAYPNWAKAIIFCLIQTRTSYNKCLNIPLNNSIIDPFLA